MFFRSNIFLNILVSWLLCAGIVHAQNEQTSVLKKVVIDPGHGGRHPGAVSAKSQEKNIVLDIALKVGKMINEKYPDVEVIYTRKTDVYVDIYKRGEIANKAQANLFISIHANANASKAPYGAETYVMGPNHSDENREVVQRENSVVLIEDDYLTRYEGFDPNKAESYIYISLLQNAFLNQSLEFAGEVQNQFKNFAKRHDRGVKQGPYLVLWKTTMPSVLIEVGFISNLEEEKYITSTAGKEKIAASIFQAFSSYKSTLEGRSTFRPADSSLKNEQPETQTPKPETQNPNGETLNEVKPETKKPESSVSKKVEFCVQIHTSSKPIDTNPKNFKQYRNVERIQISVNFFKYILGRTPDYATAQQTLKKIRVGYKDAFVVSIVDGKIVPASEGLKLITE